MDGWMCRVSWSELQTEFDGCWMNERRSLVSDGQWISLEPKIHWGQWEEKGMHKKQDGLIHEWEVWYDVWWLSDEVWWSIWMEWNSGMVCQMDVCDKLQPTGESKYINTLCTWLLQIFPSTALKVTAACNFSFNKRQFPQSFFKIDAIYYTVISKFSSKTMFWSGVDVPEDKVFLYS